MGAGRSRRAGARRGCGSGRRRRWGSLTASEEKRAPRLTPVRRFSYLYSLLFVGAVPYLAAPTNPFVGAVPDLAAPTNAFGQMKKQHFDSSIMNSK